MYLAVSTTSVAHLVVVSRLIRTYSMLSLRNYDEVSGIELC